MIEQDQQVIRIDKGLFGRTFQEIIRVMRQELIERGSRSDKDGNSRIVTTPGPTGLLPSAGNCARVTYQQSGSQATNVDAQLEGIGGNHKAGMPGAQAFFDLAALPGQIAGTITTDLCTHSAGL